MKILIPLEDNFNNEEFIYPFHRMKEAGFSVVVAAKGKQQVKDKYGFTVNVDADLEDCKEDDFDAIIIPGGYAPDKLRTYIELLELVRAMHASKKVIAAICHAGWVLVSAGIIKGKKVTSYPGIKDDMINAGAKWSDEEVVVDGSIITSRKPADLPAFCREIIKKLE